MQRKKQRINNFSEFFHFVFEVFYFKIHTDTLSETDKRCQDEENNALLSQMFDQEDMKENRFPHLLAYKVKMKILHTDI